ncbi:MAG: ABC transporter ATP-binding protein [Clostridiaceae bacterium]|nr:ABC transporter ATP-binding protein [Clostridiaceae bacterium]
MKNNKGTFRRLLKLIEKYKFLVLLSLLLAVVVVATQLYAPILFGKAVDLAIGKGNVDIKGIIIILIKTGIVIGITALAQWIMSVINNRITYRVVMDLRVQAFRHLQKLDIAYIDSHEHGDIVSRIITDIDQLSDGLLMGFTQFFTGVVTILGTLIFMFSVNVKIALIVVLLTPLSLFVASFIAKRTYSMFKKQSETRGEITSHINEMVGNQKLVKAFGREEASEEKFDEINERLTKYSLKASFFSSMVNPSTRLINAIVYAGVGGFGALSVIAGRLSVGQLSCFLSYATQYTKPFNEISGVVTELQNALASAARVFELIDEKEQLPDRDGAKELEKADGRVEFDNVCFSYDKSRELIKNLSISAKPGQRVAIVGPTGCGKSTLINLLMRFYDPDSGMIKVDGENSADFTRKSLRKNFGMVLQETWLKSGTVRENIAYSNPDATDEEIIAAAKLTHAHSFIKRLPDGYDTVLGENGGSLSQGQKQLLCITRVLLNLPPMLILDEATSSIDSHTEIRIQKTFAKMMQGRTCFVVAHRLSTIRESDIILVMNKGQIVEQGTHEQLLEKQGFYYELYNSQFALTE